MPILKKWRKPRERSHAMNGMDLRYLASKYKVTDTDVVKAIKAVGNDREKVEEYLRKA